MGEVSVCFWSLFLTEVDFSVEDTTAETGEAEACVVGSAVPVAAVGAPAGIGAAGLAVGVGAVAFVTGAPEPGAACRVTAFPVTVFRVTAFRVVRARLGACAVDTRAGTKLGNAAGTERRSTAVRLVDSDACTTVDDAPTAARGACGPSSLTASSQIEAKTEPETAAEAPTAFSAGQKLDLMDCSLPPDNQYELRIGRFRRFLNRPKEARS
jgi:hypothetical protein